MKSLLCGLLLSVVALQAPAFAAGPAGSVALVSKVILDVTRKESDTDWQTAKRGETLSTGDKVKTGEKSLAIIKFKDNSLVRVRERSELTVTGEVNRGAFSKSVNMEKGVVGFNIKKQLPDEEFRFTSPTSVASIRGTGGQFTSGTGADTLTVIEGLVRLTNKLSSRFVDVAEGFTGVSHPDGSVETRPATQEEQHAALESSKISDQENRLEFEFRDGQGNRKMLKIEYK